MASSTMHTFTSTFTNEPTWFNICAQNYMLSGKFNEICDHNAMVASQAGRTNVSNYWNILKILYTSPIGDILKTPPVPKDDVHPLNLGQMNLNNTAEQNLTIGIVLFVIHKSYIIMICVLILNVCLRT